jgi:H+-translocating diphosphatase
MHHEDRGYLPDVKNRIDTPTTKLLVETVGPILENPVAKNIFMVSPLIVWLVLFILRFTYSLQFVIMAAYISVMALVYSTYILVWLLKRDSGTEEMRKVANIIIEGSEGFFAAQYGTIVKLSFVIAGVLFFMYLFKNNDNIIRDLNTFGSFSLAVITSMSFLIGAFCSGLSGYAGMWVSIRANVRYPHISNTHVSKSILI